MKKSVDGLVFVFLIFWLCGSAWPAEKTENILAKVQEARRKLGEVELSIEVKTEKRVYKKKIRSKKTKKMTWVSYVSTTEFVAYKEIALAAWDYSDDQIHIVRLMIPPVPGQNFSFHVLTKDAAVEYVSGRSHSKFIFDVSFNGRKLMVLAGKHWWVPPEYFRNDNPKIFERYAEEIVYSAYNPDLYDPALILAGSGFLFGEIAEAKRELAKSGVMSRSFPGKLISDVMPDDYLFNLGHNEQMDHAKFDADPNLTAEEISIEYALNKSDAFRWVVSSANARGAFQFTNRGFRKNPGTYDYVVRSYPEAGLDKDFHSGTQNLRNMIKSAICLLDLELSKFPKDAVDLFASDYRSASVYPSACYNGGCGKGMKLYNWIRSHKKELRSDTVDYPVSAVGHPETHKYLEKQSFLWSYTDNIREKINSEKTKQP